MKTNSLKVIAEARLVAEEQLAFFREMRSARALKVHEPKPKQSKTQKRTKKDLPLITV